jgi:hypothetical protein
MKTGVNVCRPMQAYAKHFLVEKRPEIGLPVDNPAPPPFVLTRQGS